MENRLKRHGAQIVILLMVMLSMVLVASARQGIEMPVMLPGEPRTILAEHGVPNGMPCDWYAYATVVGLDYCDHPGTDVEAFWEPLYAATDGVVAFSGSDGYYQPYHVDIQTDDEEFVDELHIYGHMSEVYVTAGQTVECGDLIGVTGTAGNWPHLHFERRTAASDPYPAGLAIDPEPVLTKRKCE